MAAVQFSPPQVRCDVQHHVPPPTLGLAGGCSASAAPHVVPVRDAGCAKEQAKRGGKADAAERSGQGCQALLPPAVPD